MEKLKFVIFGRNSATEYSGGRYHTWMMAEALAECGHEVMYVSNALPIFFRHFQSFPNHDSVKLHIDKDMDCNIPWKTSDFVIFVPDMFSEWDFYLKAQMLAASRGAKLVFISFETPNWFNQLSPHKRDETLWVSSKRIGRKCSLILSLCSEGNRFAQEYYVTRHGRPVFDFCYPCINSLVADSVPASARENRIVWIGRFSFSEHKGTYELPSILCEQMRGHTLVMIAGSGTAPPLLMKELNERAADYGVTIEVKQKLSDGEKFKEFKRARLLLFPSQFEGFGLPPVEALYCNLPCVAFDLPVLREVCGDALLYARCGDWEDFRNTVARALKAVDEPEGLRPTIANVARFETFSDRLNRVLQKVVIEGQCGPNLLSRKFCAMSLRSQLLGWTLVQSNRKIAVRWLAAGRKGIKDITRMSAWVLHCGVRFMKTILPLKLYASIRTGYRKRRVKW